MKKIYILLLLSFPFFLSAQDCLNFPDTTFVCGFETVLPTTDFTGDWTYLCAESVGTVAINVNVAGDSTEIKVSECGEYYFLFTATAPDCMETDTIMVYFDDPSSTNTHLSISGSLEYDGDFGGSGGSNGCPTGGAGDGCGGPVSIFVPSGGANSDGPTVTWEFDISGSCSATNYLTEIINPSPDNCEAEDILDTILFSGNSLDFDFDATEEYVLAELLAILDSLDFEYLDSLPDLGCQVLNSCPGICTPNPNMAPDTTIYDTLTYILPRRVGGIWTLFIADTCMTLQDTTVFAYDDFNSTNLRLIANDGVENYGPGSLTWTLQQEYTSGTDTTYAGYNGYYPLNIQWKEFFEYDTIVDIREYTITSPDFLCSNCGGSSFSTSHTISPLAPSYGCGPVPLTFFYDECLCNPPYLDAIVHNDINCVEPCTSVDLITDTWGAFFTIYTPSGVINTPDIVYTACEIGQYQVEVFSDFGCVAFTSFVVTGDFEEFESSFNANVCEGECYEWNNEIYCQSGSYEQTLIAESNGCDSVVTLNLLVNPMQEEFDYQQVCFGETYNGYPVGTYQEVINQCLILNIVVEELPPNPPIIEELTGCFGDCIEWNGLDICSPGVYSSYFTDENGCDQEEMLICLWELVMIPEITVSNDINCSQPTATLSVSGSFNSYSWEGGNTSSSLTVSSGGTYSVTVTSENGCESDFSVSVNENIETTYEYETINLCNGQCYNIDGQDICETGVVTSTTSNPLDGCEIVTEYQITVGELEENYQTELVCPGTEYEGYSAGEYTIESTDDNGCVSTVYLTVSESSVQNTEENLLTCDGNCIDWNGMTLCNSGTYTNEIEENGCMVTQTLNLTVEDPISFNIEVSNAIDCDNESVTLSVPFQSGTYEWSTGETGNSITVDAAGQYSVTYNSENNCVNSVSTTVEEVIENTVLEEILYLCPGECILVNGEEICEEGMYTSVVGDGACTTTFISEVRQMYAEITPTIVPSLDCDNNQGSLYLAFNNVWSAFLEFTIIYPDGNIIQTTEMPLVTNITQGGTMQFIGYYYSANGSTCETTLEIEIPDNSEEIEIAMAGNPEISCLTGYAQPETNTLDGYQYLWSGPSITSSNATQVNPQLTEAGTYNLTVSNPNSGCSNSSQFVVLPQPEVEVTTAIEEQISCQTGYAQPQTTVYSDYNYIWTGNGITAQNMTEINPNLSVEGVYTVSVTNPQNSCTGTAEFTVLAQTEINALAESTATCEDASDGQATIVDVTGGTAPYLYSIDGENWQTEATFTGLETGEYELQIQDIENCETEVLSSVTALSTLPEIEFEMTDFTVCGRQEVIIDATVVGSGNLDYLWSNGQTESILVTSEEGTYEVIISNECASETVSYSIENAKEDPNKFIYIPDAFSPNADTNNETFKGYFGKEVMDYQVRVFDRWGNIVFSSTNPEEGWDGSKKGQKLGNGVYIWQMRVGMEGCDEAVQTVDLSGDVLLLK